MLKQKEKNNKLIDINISEKDLKKLFKENPTLKNKDNILYFIEMKGGLK